MVAATSKVEAIEIDGIEHIHSNLYHVSPDDIQYAEAPDYESSDLTFYNPRHTVDSNGKSVAIGLAKKEMDELYSSIKEEGLHHPLCLRLEDDDTLRLISGERRLRIISKMIKKDEKVFNPATEKMEPASEVYAFIECRIVKCDIKKAWRQAYSVNAQSVGIGPGATVAFVRHLRKANYKDQEVLDIVKHQKSWLRDTDLLIEKLDEKTFDALINNEIRRSVALALAGIEDLEQRLERLEHAKKAHDKRIASIKMQVVEKAKKAATKKEIAEAAEADALLRDDDEAAEEAAADIAAAEAEAAAAEEELDELESNKLPAATQDLKSEDGPKPLSRVKIGKFLHTPATELIKSGIEEHDGSIDLEDIQLVKLVTAQIEKPTLVDGEGRPDLLKILKHHMKNKTRRASKTKK